MHVATYIMVYLSEFLLLEDAIIMVNTDQTLSCTMFSCGIMIECWTFHVCLQVKLASCQRIVLLNYNAEEKMIDFRHYSIRLQPVGVSKRIRRIVQTHQVPDLRNLHDVSEFLTK